VGKSLLKPTRIYVKQLMPAVEQDLILGMAHITGGGLEDNIPRMLPKHLAADIDVSTWSVPPVLRWLKKAGNVSSREFARTWNTGLGMVLVASAEKADKLVQALDDAGEKAVRMGKLVKHEGQGVILHKMEVWDEAS